MPSAEDLSFLNRVIGRSEDEMLVLTESALDDRIQNAHGDRIKETETLEEQRIREERLKLPGGMGPVGLVAYVLWTDGPTGFDLQPLRPEVTAVYLVIFGYFELELLIQLLDTIDRVSRIRDACDQFRNVLLAVLASLIAILLISMIEVISFDLFRAVGGRPRWRSERA